MGVKARGVPLGMKEPQKEEPNREIPTETNQVHRAKFAPMTKLQEVVSVYPKGTFPNRLETRI